MKRGLVRRERPESASSACTSRLEALRSRLRAGGLEAALVYGDVSRSGGMDYLTGFCLYWNEAVLIVPCEGPPALVTKLSKRVQPWIRATSVLEDVRSGPRVGENVAAFLAQRLGAGRKRVGLVDMQWWPHGLVEGLEAAMPEATFIDLPRAVRDLRLIPDPEEGALLREAGGLLEAVVGAAWAAGADAATRTGTVVREARMHGFLDVDVACRALEDGSECIDAVGQYGYVWVRLGRAGRGAVGRAAAGALNGVIDEIRAGVSERDLAQGLRGRIDGPYRYVFSCAATADIESRGGFGFPAEAERPFGAGEVVVPVLSLQHGRDGVATVAEPVVVGRDRAERLCPADRA